MLQLEVNGLFVGPIAKLHRSVMEQPLAHRRMGNDLAAKAQIVTYRVAIPELSSIARPPVIQSALTLAAAFVASPCTTQPNP